MLLTCPQCETIFRVGRLRLHPAGYAEFCVISSQIPFAGDCGSDLRRVNDITYQRPRHSNRLFSWIDRGLSPDWPSHIAAD